MTLYPRLLFFLPSSSSSLSTNGFSDKCLEIVLYSRILHILDIYPCFSSLATASSRLRESPSPSESTQGFLASAMTWRLGFLHQPWRLFLWKDQAILYRMPSRISLVHRYEGDTKNVLHFRYFSVYSLISFLFLCLQYWRVFRTCSYVLHRIKNNNTSNIITFNVVQPKKVQIFTPALFYINCLLEPHPMKKINRTWKYRVICLTGTPLNLLSVGR